MTCAVTGILKMIASGKTLSEMFDADDTKKLNNGEIYDIGWQDGQIELAREILKLMEDQKNGTANGQC